MPRRPHGVSVPLEHISSDQVQVQSWARHVHHLPSEGSPRAVVDMVLDFPEGRVMAAILVSDIDFSKASAHTERTVMVRPYKDGIYATHIALDEHTIAPLQPID